MRNPSKILSVKEAKASVLGTKIIAQQKLVAKAEKALAKEEAALQKLVDQQVKAEERRSKVHTNGKEDLITAASGYPE